MKKRDPRMSEELDRTLQSTRGAVRDAWGSESRGERIERLKRRRLAREAEEAKATHQRRVEPVRWVNDQEPLPNVQPEVSVNSSHEQYVEQALRGRTSFQYRGWLITVWPKTTERDDGKKATAEAVPFDKSKIPPGKKMLAGTVMDPARNTPQQLRLGLGGLMASVDGLEDKPRAG